MDSLKIEMAILLQGHCICTVITNQLLLVHDSNAIDLKLHHPQASR
jgi:hypothetical protein